MDFRNKIKCEEGEKREQAIDEKRLRLLLGMEMANWEFTELGLTEEEGKSYYQKDFFSSSEEARSDVELIMLGDVRVSELAEQLQDEIVEDEKGESLIERENPLFGLMAISKDFVPEVRQEVCGLIDEVVRSAIMWAYNRDITFFKAMDEGKLVVLRDVVNLIFLEEVREPKVMLAKAQNDVFVNVLECMNSVDVYKMRLVNKAWYSQAAYVLQDRRKRIWDDESWGDNDNVRSLLGENICCGEEKCDCTVQEKSKIMSRYEEHCVEEYEYVWGVLQMLPDPHQLTMLGAMMLVHNYDLQGSIVRDFRYRLLHDYVRALRKNNRKNDKRIDIIWKHFRLKVNEDADERWDCLAFKAVEVWVDPSDWVSRSSQERWTISYSRRRENPHKD